MAQPYDPPAGQEGSKAIHMDSPLFKGWAIDCVVQRGPGIITHPDSIAVTYGSAADATGKAGEGKVVSLGDGGIATLFFESPIVNGPGPDIAVFENSLNDTFLELAFVEISSDTKNFVRFDAVSLTPIENQVSTFGSIDARNLNNLAGKYKGGYGTPFDLDELAGQPGIDIYNILCVRIIDVIGTVIDSLASRDSRDMIINDPWPTPFESCGFDLDAVGVINNQTIVSDESTFQEDIEMYPNPVNSTLRISIPGSFENIVFVFNIHGRMIRSEKFTISEIYLQMESFEQGLFIIRVIDDKGFSHQKIIQKI